MPKLSKEEAARHQEAERLLEKDILTVAEREFVLEHWHEGARHLNSVAGAFFTPLELARDFAVEVTGRKIIDLCAGIGRLSYVIKAAADISRQPLDLTCIEINKDYVEVGRKILPEARWIHADVLDLSKLDLGTFDCAIGNPPFGAIRTDTKAPRYKGSHFEYAVIDLASDMADYGVFIVPQGSAPFQMSGTQTFRHATSQKYEAFVKSTGISLQPNCGLDTSGYDHLWRGTSPRTEIVCADFKEIRAERQVSASSQDSLIAGLKAGHSINPAVATRPQQADLFA
ncbi:MULTISPECIES: methyltransferase [Microvirga]|uniref:methyltransferase n=1 Tax=Microvirga TaxID=186650 RepID=UPI0021C718E4|nr:MULTISPECIES: methyltransferase [unclassified Microvirga]